MKDDARTQAEQDALLEVLRSAWRDQPHMRLCQLIVNATGRRDPFYVEDDDLAHALIEYEPGDIGQTRT